MWFDSRVAIAWWALSKCTNKTKIHLWLDTYNALYYKCSHKLDFCFICLKINRADFQYFSFRAHKFVVFAECFPSDYSACIKLVVVVVVCQWRAALRLKYVIVFLLRCFCVWHLWFGKPHEHSSVCPPKTLQTHIRHKCIKVGHFIACPFQMDDKLRSGC